MARTPWANQPSRHERGYGWRWEKLRARILKRDGYLCQPCKRQGRVTQATEVDHIKPKAKDGADDEANLQAICTPCHDAKSAIDAGRRPRRVIGADGWPVD